MAQIKRKLREAEIYERQAEICAALASPVRLMILDLLSEGEATATELQKELGLPKSNLSQHLRVLKSAGILNVRSEGLFQYMSIAIPEVMQACALVGKVLSVQVQKELETARGWKAKLS